ncbi:MAG: hypothetical protein V7742_00310 [Halioglobus sp.]
MNDKKIDHGSPTTLISSQRVLQSLNLGFYLLTALIILNSLLYLIFASTRYIKSDDWFYIGQILVPWFSGDFSWSNLLVIRGTGDRIQLFHRAFLILNAEYFSLNMLIRGVVGFSFYVACLVVLLRHFRETNLFGCQKHRFGGVIAMSLALCFFSFNSTVNLTWPLVTLGYAVYLVIFLFFIFLSKNISKERPNHKGLALFAAVALLMGDDTAMLACIAAALILSIYCYTTREFQRNIKSILAISAVLLGYVLLKREFVEYLNNRNSETAILEYFLADPFVIVKYILRSLSNSVVFFHHLKFFEPKHADKIAYAIGSLVLFLQLTSLFLYIYFDKHRKSIVPIAMLLLYWGLLAGVMIYRLPGTGLTAGDYPRYIRSYSIGLFATAIMLVSILPDIQNILMLKARSIRRLLYSLFALIFCSFLLLQIVFIEGRWSSLSYLLNHHERIELRINEYGNAESVNSLTGKSICPGKIDTCYEKVQFLKKERLNIFSAYY